MCRQEVSDPPPVPTLNEGLLMLHPWLSYLLENHPPQMRSCSVAILFIARIQIHAAAKLHPPRVIGMLIMRRNMLNTSVPNARGKRTCCYTS